MIEEIIHKNIDSFYNEDIPDGHFERFEQKLNNAFPNSQNNNSIRILMIAASILFFISTLTVILINTKYTMPDKLILSNVTPEIYETEQFYMNAISEKINILTVKRKMTSELNSDLKDIDKTIMSIGKEIALNPGDERLICAVINVYQTKLDLLDDIIVHTR
jgi:hypothetical protein